VPEAAAGEHQTIACLPNLEAVAANQVPAEGSPAGDPELLHRNPAFAVIARQHDHG